MKSPKELIRESMKLLENAQIETSTGLILSGPRQYLQQATKLNNIMSVEMDQVMAEYEPEGESRAMDERDDVFFEYEERFKQLGYIVIN